MFGPDPPPPSRQLGAQQRQYALVNGAVFDARTGSVVPRAAVLVEGDRIRAVCPPDDLGSGILKVDLSGKTVLPGLIDVHVHTEDWHAPLFLAKGITAVRDAGCELEAVLCRRAAWNSSHQAPRLVCTGPLLDNAGNTWPATTRTVQTPQEARFWVDRLAELGVDQIKAYAFLDWPCFSAVLEQAHRHGMFVLAHLGRHVNARQAVVAGLDELEHLSGIAEALWSERNQDPGRWEFFKLWSSVDLEQANRLIDLLVEKGVWIAVTRLVWLRLATIEDSRHSSHPQMAYTPETLRDFWRTFSSQDQSVPRAPKGMPKPNRADRNQQVAGMAIFAGELFRRDAKILIGTDSPFPHLLPGFSFHDEMRALIECGLGVPAALQAATIAGAQALQIDDLVGTLEAGKAADLVVVNGNPVADINNLEHIHAVVRDGHWLDPEELLRQAAQYARSPERRTAKRFDEVY